MVESVLTSGDGSEEYNLRIFRPLAHYLKDHGFAAFLPELAQRAGVQEQDLLKGGSWVSHQSMEFLVAGAREKLGSDDVYFKAASWKMLESFGPLLMLIRATSPDAVYRRVAQESKAVTKASSFEVQAISPRRVALIHRTIRPESRLLCLLRQAQAALLPTAWGLPPALIKETSCVCLGDPTCTYELSWHEAPRALPSLLGLLGGVLALIAYAAMGHAIEASEFLLPLFGWLLGAYYEKARVHRIHVQTITDAQGAVRQAAAEESEARLESQKSSQALSESVTRFAAVMEKSEDMVTLRDAQGGLIWCSPSIQKVLGYGAEEFGSLPSKDFVNAEDLEKVSSLIGGLMPGETVHAGNMRVRHKDGRWRIAEAAHTNLLQDPAVSAIVSNFRDVTERVSLEEQLRQSQKMEGIGKLASGVAHDFNNILSVILGYASLLLEGSKPGDKEHLGLSEIQAASERATQLTRQLLAFSRQQILDPKMLDLNDVVQGMDSMLRRMVGEDVVFLTKSKKDLGLVKVNPTQMQQVLMNLVVNARDAMPQGGRLTIETQNVELDEAYIRAHLGVKAGPYVMLAVSDSGVGMDREIQARIFEPFFSTKPKDKGTGLGLSTIFGIVRQSGGHIWVYSEPGKGSSFKVYFPRVEGQKDAASLPLAVAPPLRGHECILLVEDEPQVRKLAKQILERTGYQVLEAGDGYHAIEVSLAHPGSIELLLTDVIMPLMSGKQLAEQLLPQRPKMRVLYVSGYTDNSIVHHGILDDGIAFLQKPFSPSGLAQKVREVLDQA